MSELVAPPKVYKPDYDENTGQYVDKSPYGVRERNCLTYECICNRTQFCGNGPYNQHIKTKVHKTYIKNYDKNNKELIDLKTENTVLLAENEILKRKYQKSSNKVEKLEKEIKKINTFEIHLNN